MYSPPVERRRGPVRALTAMAGSWFTRILTAWRASVLVLSSVLLAACGGEPVPVTTGASGHTAGQATLAADSASCAGCHPRVYTAWKDSHHARAMRAIGDGGQPAHFDGRWLRHGEEAVRFVVEDDSARMELADGRRFPVPMRFGLLPLEQYLIDVGGGRLQASTWAWDSRPATAGGQRWFFLYPEDDNRPGSRLHWRGALHNWNHQCAACHATHLEKRHEPAMDRYTTRYSEIGVGCAACHGDANAHVAWAAGSREPLPRAGFARPVDAPSARFAFDGTSPIARRVDGTGPSADVDACGRCHARGAPLADDDPARSLFDLQRPALLDPGLYFADGRMDEEVFNWGSFRQSRMYEAGVGCGHCHDPHAGTLRAEGDALCGQCHLGEVYDATAHRGHDEAEEPPLCTDCHLPQRTYMVIDDRHDHAFHRPDPAEAERVGAPDACSDCHRDRDAGWKAAAIATWQRVDAKPRRAYADALHAGRTWRVDAGTRLQAIVADPGQATLVRASALSLLGRQPGARLWPLATTLVAAPDPVLRLAVARLLESAPADWARETAPRLLTDRHRSIRGEAVRALLRRPDIARAPAPATTFERALEEYRQSLARDQDRSSGLVGLAAIDLLRGEHSRALERLRRATEIDPHETVAWINRIEVERLVGGEAAVAVVLGEALAIHPDSAELWHVKGLHAVRNREPDEALAALARAAEIAPDEPRYTYVLGIARHGLESPESGRRTLTEAIERQPGFAPFHQALADWAAAAGDEAGARVHARQVATLLE
jgi:tetratricopeptide (TPR) repeat protein